MRFIFPMALALALCVSGCSRSKDVVIPTDPSKWSQLADQTKDLSANDKQLLGAYLARNTLGNIFTHSGGIPPGTKVGEAIDQQRDFAAKQQLADAQADALKARAAAERQAAIDKLNHLVTFAVVSKTLEPKNYQAGQFSDRIAFVFAVKNNTTKNISGVKGTLEFRDMFGTTIEDVSVSLDRPVPANSEKTIDGFGKDLNQFESSDQQLAITDLSKMKVAFLPEMVVFADGTSEKAPDEAQ